MRNDEAPIWYNLHRGEVMARQDDPNEFSFMVHGDQPLIGILTEEDGEEVVRYFVEEEAADSAIPGSASEGALSVIGAWSDLEWDAMERSLDRTRHESPPTPLIEL
jgi:hypothetical protein